MDARLVIVEDGHAVTIPPDVEATERSAPGAIDRYVAAAIAALADSPTAIPTDAPKEAE